MNDHSETVLEKPLTDDDKRRRRALIEERAKARAQVGAAKEPTSNPEIER